MATKSSRSRAVLKRHKPRSGRNGRKAPSPSNVGEGAIIELTLVDRVISRRLAAVNELDAVFVSMDEDAIVHVYSVVSDYDDSIYRHLLKQERLIERDLPETRLEFHLRAHQGREPRRAVQFGSRPLFVQ